MIEEIPVFEQCGPYKYFFLLALATKVMFSAQKKERLINYTLHLIIARFLKLCFQIT